MGNLISNVKGKGDTGNAPTTQVGKSDKTGVLDVLGGAKVDQSRPPVEVLEPTLVAVKASSKKTDTTEPVGLDQHLPVRKTQKAWIEEKMAQEDAEARERTLTSVHLLTSTDLETTPELPLKPSLPPGRGAGGGMAGGGTKTSSETAMDRMVNRARGEAEITFLRYDLDKDGYLTREDLYIGMQELGLGLTPEMYRQYVDCNFMYADMDGDDRLSLEEYLVIHGMIHEVKRKFERFDKDGDGLINKSDFTKIVKELHLNLDESMVQSYVDMNFRFVDRSFRGTVSFGQFLACYANFLISHSLMHSNKPGHGGAPGGTRPTSSAPPMTAGNMLLEDIDEDENIRLHGGGPLR